jgi:hypothetical protein
MCLVEAIPSPWREKARMRGLINQLPTCPVTLTLTLSQRERGFMGQQWYYVKP